MPPLSCICVLGLKKKVVDYISFSNNVKQEVLIFVLPPPWFYFSIAHKTFYGHYKHTSASNA